MRQATRYYGVDEYAREKDFHAEKLRAWGYYDKRHAVAMPERDITGREINLKLRHPEDSANRFTYPTYRYPIPAGLWRLPEWRDADTIYLCEGETDMLTLWHADLPALGIQGADRWRAEWWQYLIGFPRIVLIPDNDEAGAGLVREIAKTCPDRLRERVYVLQLPSSVKDANELWKQVRGVEDPERFKEALAQCAVQPITAIPTEDEPAELVLQLGHTREREVAHALVPNLLYAERITVLAGESGVGKSTFALEIADALTRTGKLWNDTVEVQPARVLWLDFDHSWGRLQEIIDAYYGEGEREIYTIAPEHLVALEPQTLPAYRRAIEQYGIDLIVADTAFDWLAVLDANDETEARVKLQLVRELIAGTGCGVLLLHHLRKNSLDSSSTFALSGAHRWAAKADAVAYLRHNSREGQDIVKLLILKDRDGERREVEFLRQGRRFLPLQREAVPAGDWGVVRAYLQAHGEATYQELLNALEQAGERITERALQAKVKRWERKGRVVIERRGFPPTAFVKLAAAQFTHSPPSWQTGVQNVQNVQNGEHEEVAANLPVLPVLHILHTPSQSVQNDNTPDCPKHALPESYDPRSETDAEWLARAEQVLDQFYPSFQDRVELTWDRLDDWLQQAAMPNDPLGLEPHEVEALRVLLAYAEARGFPSLTLPEYGYTIQAGCDGWLNALPDIAGTPAVAIATRMLQALDTAGSPAVPAHRRTNGDAGRTPSQFSLEV